MKKIPKTKQIVDVILPPKKVGEVVVQTKKCNELIGILERATDELEEKLGAILPIERKGIMDKTLLPTNSVTPQSIQLERLNYRLKNIIGQINAMKNTVEL
jgi:hypothetical protein